MAPRYFRGELVYLHPGKPVTAERDCVIELQDGTVLLRRCQSQQEDRMVVRQFSPDCEKDIFRRQIRAVYAVVGRG